LEGKVLGGRYELLEMVGEGGMASVYKARCRILDRIVAIKILKEQFQKDASFIEKFKTEALAAARISHPNIVSIYDVGQDGDIYYIVMEYVEGHTLKDMIIQEGILPIDKAVNIAIMICDGVNHAHEKGVIHRDIKPHNILITPQGMVKVADFGIARAISNTTITFGKNLVGSVHYISPEQARGVAIDRTTDIYSIGCVLYEMVTGKVPFDADSPITVALKHIHDEVRPPAELNPAVPPNLQAIILKAMAKLPAERFASAEEMRNSLLHLPETVLDYPHRQEKTIIMDSISDKGMKSSVRKRKKRKIKPFSAALLVIALLAFASGVLSVVGKSFFGSEIVVPDVVGKNITEAEKELSQAGLVMNIIAYQNDDNIEKDCIISQDPAKDRKVKKGREVKVVVSQGSEMVRVPDLQGITVSDASIRLQNVGLKSGTISEQYDNKFSQGLIISQDPASGKLVKPGSQVNMLVSKGIEPEKVQIPNLVGLSLEKASKKLQDAGFVTGEVTKQSSDKYASGQVISQGVEAGVLAPKGSSVNLTISSGPGPSSRTRSLEIKLPSQEEYYKVQVRLTDQNGTREIYNKTHQAREIVYVDVNYQGNATCQVLLNGQEYHTYKL